MATLDLSSVRITYQYVQDLYEWMVVPAQLWRMQVDALVEDGSGERIVVADGEALMVDIYAKEPLASLMQHGPRALRIGEILFDRRTNELDARLLEGLEMIGSQVLVIKEFRVTAEWRGTGLSQLIGGLIIKKLANWAVAVAYAPADHAADAAEARELADRWATLGFREFRDGVYILDPELPAFHAAFDKIVRRVLTTTVHP